MNNTKIEWTDATWNPIRGCSRVSEGCRNCYAERVAARFSGPGMPYHDLAYMDDSGYGSNPRWTGEVRLIESALDWPLRKKKPLHIFVNSMSDLFHERVPDEWIDRIYAVMALAPIHIFQVLTKRPERALDYFQGDPYNRILRQADKIRMSRRVSHVGISDPNIRPLKNVWLGVSVEDQATADEHIPLLLQTPGAVRWVSYEPALGPVDFQYATFNGSDSLQSLEGLHWIVCGGESGPGARPFDIAWARIVRDQCKAAGVPFFMKQLGARPCDPSFQDDMIKLKNKKGGDMAEWPEDLRIREFPVS